ncbi:MAG: energy transducer TonB [Hyphomicrobium sp.]|nr:energy transducer TonB [Hyphomicrobium sp.]
MTLQYNITDGQPDRPIGIAPTSGRSLGTAISASLGLHGLAVVAALMAFGPQRPAIDDSAAITVYIEPDAAPVATASESRPITAPAPAPDPEPEPEATAALNPPKEPALPDFAPLPPEELALPDFSVPPPPPPKPAQPAPRPAQPKPEPKRAAPTVAKLAPAESASPAPPAPAAASASAVVAPGWNALLAAWLAANRRYPEDARRRSEEGEVTVRFTVVPDGRVSEAAVVKGSGVASLDAAALRLLQGATLPAPGIEATRTVRIRFRLGD